ncbi:anaerobic ribonucleoside-triphosphate reductase activating protein [uncultured Mobiluncus sp.]|uniref:anaerobic ribonucleoside-triphosphate reductase activating protein n=1 Tax=uncultured Mobiluncus sp. TaxID=293425 RepID=UPI002627884E|nr:anaerobic ribonucleoside-triphosphate reductase activating protein [uncultured Mobiluncus sp.]
MNTGCIDEQNETDCPLTGLVIAGVTPFSTVDWPGKLAASVFLQGCPWNCGYCQNFAIIDPRTPAGYEEADLWELLGRRRGLLDGVVFSGGEPTRQAALVPAAQRVRDLGFLVGLHTGGAYPQRLVQLLEAGLLDWVGIDVKGLAQNYPQVVGRTQARQAGTDAWKALDLVLAAHRAGTLPDYEVRVTAYPGTEAGDTNPSALPALARALQERGVERLALQQARPDGTRPEFQELCAQTQAKSFAADLARQAEELTGMFAHFVFRGSAG